MLDLCAGTGRIAGPLAAAGYEVTAVERDPEAVRRGRTAWPGVRFVEADVRDLSGLPGPFGAVLCLWQSFGWFDEAGNRTVFSAMADRVAPGGRLVIDVYRRDHPGLEVFERRHRASVQYPDGFSECFDWELFTPEEIADLGGTHGLRVALICARWNEGTPADPAIRDFQIVLSRPPV